MDTQPGHRYHSLDALRAAMMLLGLVLHSATVDYHYMVRSTLIGELLNGRRYPRTLPVLLPSDRHETVSR